jgi:cell division septation protein DedD
MTDTAPHSEQDKLRAFEQRIQTEGAAGFADGLEPWDEWRETDTEGGNPMWKSARHTDPEAPKKTTCERLLSTMASLAVITLVVGIGAIYLSTDTAPLITVNSVQPPPISAPTGMAPDLSLPAPVIRTILPALKSDMPPIQLPATGIFPAPPVNNSTAKEATEPLVAQPEAPLEQTAVSTDVTDTTEALPPPAAGTPPAPAAENLQPAANDGVWVVNISSYLHESMAEKKLAEFREKGVTAEIIIVTVNDRTMHRIRAIGYDNFAEARNQVSSLEDRLGIERAWVSKR